MSLPPRSNATCNHSRRSAPGAKPAPVGKLRAPPCFLCALGPESCQNRRGQMAVPLICSAMLASINHLSSFLLITSLEPQQFHAVTHSFAQRESTIPSIFSGLRTLLMSIGGGTPLRVSLLDAFRCHSGKPNFHCRQPVPSHWRSPSAIIMGHLRAT